MIALIDADSLIYICAYNRGPDESVLELHNRLDQIKENTKCDEIALFLTIGRTFRHEIQEYKQNRSNKRKLPVFYYLKEYMITELNANYQSLVEADDLVSYYGMITPDSLICSPDKDVINSNYRVFNYNKNELVVNEQKDIDKFFCKQMLMGDSGDGIKGIPGVGEQRANLLLANFKTIEDGITNVLQKYIEYYKLNLGVTKFHETFKQLYLLKFEEDYIKEGLVVPKKTITTINEN